MFPFPPGGVFITTLIGLVIAMLTLGGEVLYYSRKNKKKSEANPSNGKMDKIHPVNI